MGSLFGQEYLTADEVQGAEVANFEQMKAEVAANPLALAAISQQQAVYNVLGSPTLRKAKLRDKAIQESLAAVQQEDGEGEYEFEIRKAKELRSRLAKVDPTLAMAANQQILQMQTGQRERDSLLFDKKVKEEDYDRSRTFGITATDPKTGVSRPVKLFKPGEKPEVMQAELDKLAQSPSGKSVEYDLVNYDSYFSQQTPAEPFDPRKYGPGSRGGKGAKGAYSPPGINKSNISDSRGRIEAAIGAVAGTGEVIDTLYNDPLSGVNILGNGITQANSVASSAIGAMISWMGDERGRAFTPKESEDMSKSIWDGDIKKVREQTTKLRGAIEKVAPGAFDSTQNRELLEAQMLNLAYVIAKTLDPGGRLSNQDVEIAIKMITGTAGDADTIRKLLWNRVERNNEQLKYTLQRAKKGYLEETEGDDIWIGAANDYERMLEETAGKIEALQVKLKESGLTSYLGKESVYDPATGKYVIPNSAAAQAVSDQMGTVRTLPSGRTFSIGKPQ